MALRINTNVAALNTHRQLVDSDRRLGVSLERLSSGYRINQAKDDVAGLAIANKFRLESRGLRMAQQNISQGSSLLNMAEGATNQIEQIVERLKELATSAASQNVDQNGRDRLNAEAGKLPVRSRFRYWFDYSMLNQFRDPFGFDIADEAEFLDRAGRAHLDDLG